MKEFKERLFSLRESQSKLMKEYQQLLAEYESDDLITENEVIRSKLEDYSQQLNLLHERLQHTEKENRSLRQSLSEQIMDEKLNIIKVSKEKMNTYFGVNHQTHENRLVSVEHKFKHDIQQLYSRADQHLNEEKEQIASKLEELSTDLEQRIWQHRQQWLERESRIAADHEHTMGQLESEEISEETMQLRMKQNQFEMKIGLNWINKIAILLIVLGVGAAFKYSYSEWFGGQMKGMVFFLLGLLMLGGGEWLFRKGRETFSLGLLGGGVSVLYGSIFYSYFLLEIINLYTGLGLSVLVTVIAALLSLRYQSRTICSLALIGGYLPLFSYIGAFGLHGTAVYIAMSYLLMLNGFMLLISLKKRWSIVNYISFLFNVPLMLVLILLGSNVYLNMVYALVTFIMYLGITLWYPLKFRAKISWWDFVMLALNTVISCSTIYALLADMGLENFKGLLALIFCLVYIALGRLVSRATPQEKKARLLFFATAITFAVLMIPFQLGMKWAALGWLIEGVVLIILGNRHVIKSLERVGWSIVTLCMGSFLLVDFLFYKFVRGDHLFNMKYSLLTVGLLIITAYYALQYRQKQSVVGNKSWERKIIAAFKYVALINVWFYLMYEVGQIYKALVPADFVQYQLYRTLLIALVTLVLGYVLTKLTLLRDAFVKFYAVFLHIVGYFLSLCVTLFMPALGTDGSNHLPAHYIALIVLVGFNILVFFSGRDLVKSFLSRGLKNIELYPMIMGIYLLAIMTALLNIQFRLGDISFLFSLLYLLLAIGYIMYGFRNKYVYIRRLGLGLTLFATGKMVIYDLSYLSTGGKIVAYFCFGLLLLGISYLYQRVSLSMGEPRHQPEEIESQGSDIS